MNKYILLFIILFILNNCSELKFVYEKNDNLKTLNNLTNIIVSGESSNEFYLHLNESIGDIDASKAKYSLLVSFLKKESAQVIDKDATASKFSISYETNYTLYNLTKNCILFEKIITTTNNYSAKSAGYSFGTDLSQKEANIQNIRKNINQFITSLNQTPDLDGCLI